MKYCEILPKYYNIPPWGIFSNKGVAGFYFRGKGLQVEGTGWTRNQTDRFRLSLPCTPKGAKEIGVSGFRVTSYGAPAV